MTAQAIMEHIRVNDLEIVVLVEGIESVTSNKMQARFSYAAEDIVPNATSRSSSRLYRWMRRVQTRCFCRVCCEELI